MSTTTRFATAAAFSMVILAGLMSTPAQAREGRFRLGLLRLADRGDVVARQPIAPSYAYPTADPSYGAAHEARAHYYDDAPPAVEAAAYVPAETAAPALSYGGDPYGFTALLNQVRASAGLPPVGVDPNLSSWAGQNNSAQSRRGLGHHVNPNCLQNCAWNYGDASSVINGWMQSPGHRANLLSPSIRAVGIAHGPGPYWTMNAR